MGGAALPWEAQHASLGDDSVRGGAVREDTGGRRADWGLPLGQDVLDGLGLLQYCQELLGTVLDSVAEQSSQSRNGTDRDLLF